MLSVGCGTVIDAGEVLCVEVPYYEIGSKGLAVRDTLLLTSTGARAMNRSRRDLIVLD
jgi:Xaa-Pro aminopeptidase